MFNINILRLWHGNDSTNVAEERIDLVDLWCCKRSSRYGGELVCTAVQAKVAIVNDMKKIRPQWTIES